MNRTAPTPPADWNDEAEVQKFYDAQNAYHRAEAQRKARKHAKRWTYKGLDEWLQGRNYESRKLARNTYLKRRNGHIAVQYHATDVVSYYPNGDIVLNSGGWLTMTTKERIDWFTPAWLRVSQNRGVWYITIRDLNSKDYWAAKATHRFFDGITFGPRGGCRNPMSESAREREDRDNKETDRQIKRYVAGWIETAVTGQMPLPSGGDCWYCCMFPESKGEGEADHLLSHIEEEYYVPSLIVKAAEAKRYGDPMFVLSYVMGLRPAEDGEHFDGATVRVKEVRQLLTWYMRKHLRKNMSPPR